MAVPIGSPVVTAPVIRTTWTADHMLPDQDHVYVPVSAAVSRFHHTDVLFAVTVRLPPRTYSATRVHPAGPVAVAAPTSQRSRKATMMSPAAAPVGTAVDTEGW